MNCLQRTFLAHESISFQNGKFFTEMTAAVADIRALRTTIVANSRSFYRSREIKALLDVIKEHTGMKMHMEPGGPAIMPPQINVNHVFYSDGIRELMTSSDHDPAGDAHEIMEALGKRTFHGGVDLKNNRVFGSFCEIDLALYMPQELFADLKYDDDEVAAIILHECGHAETFFEYVSRVATTNQNLALLSRWMDKSIDDAQRVILFSEAATKLELKKEEAEALKKAKHAKDIAVVLIDSDTRAMQSELGGSLYDVNSCEYLADQYAARCGAALPLATGLDKLMSEYGGTARSMMVQRILLIWIYIVVPILAIGPAGVLFAILFPLIYALGQDKANDVYDKPNARIERLRQQLVQQVKENPDSEAVLEWVKQADKIKSLINSGKFTDALNWGEKAAFILKPSFRDAHRSELLQKELESLAYNDLFAEAARLRAAA